MHENNCFEKFPTFLYFRRCCPPFPFTFPFTSKDHGQTVPARQGRDSQTRTHACEAHTAFYPKEDKHIHTTSVSFPTSSTTSIVLPVSFLYIHQLYTTTYLFKQRRRGGVRNLPPSLYPVPHHPPTFRRAKIMERSVFDTPRLATESKCMSASVSRARL